MLFRALLPASVEIAEMDPRLASIDTLHPLELAAVAQAVPRRQREFAAGRQLSHGLLARLGAPAGPLLPASDRSPVWPDGFVGSITHCETLAAVAVACASEIRAIGIDVEPALPLPPGVAEMILLPEEEGASVAGPLRGRLVFSAKEAFYKAIYPLTRQFLDFVDVSVSFQAIGFHATLRRDVSPFRSGDRFAGRWAADGVHMGTSLVILHRAPLFAP